MFHWLKNRIARLQGSPPRICVGGWLLVVVLLTLFSPFLVQNMWIDSQPWRFNDDVVQQIPPFYRFMPETPALGEDYIFTYYLDCLPLGFRAMYATAAMTTGDPRPWSKALPYVLLGGLLCVSGWTAHRLGGWPLAIALLLTMLSANIYLERMSGGLPRAFGYITTAVALAGLVAGRWQIIVAAIALGAAFYPATGFFVGVCLGVYLLCEPGPHGKATLADWLRRGAILAAGAMVGLVLLVPVMQGSSGYGGIITAADEAQFPEVGPGGRYSSVDRELPVAEALKHAAWMPLLMLVDDPKPEAVLSPFYSAMIHSYGAGFLLRPINVVVVVLALLAAWGGYRRLKSGDAAFRRLCYAIAAVMVALGLSLAVSPYLYLPFRYLRYCWGPLSLLLLLGGLQGLRWPLVDRQLCPRSLGDWRQFLLNPPVLAAVGLFILVGSLGGYQARIDASPHLPAMNWLEAKSRTDPGLIAGWPLGVMDIVPYLSRRPVLLNYEVHQVFHRDYVKEMRKRMDLTIAAWIHGDRAALQAMNTDYNVRYLLLESPTTTKYHHHRYMEPFDTQIVQAREDAGGTGKVALEQIVEDHPSTVVYEDDLVKIVDLPQLLEATSGQPDS